MPDASFLISPALSISLWLAISASAGTSLSVWKNILDTLIIKSSSNKKLGISDPLAFKASTLFITFRLYILQYTFYIDFEYCKIYSFAEETRMPLFSQLNINILCYTMSRVGLVRADNTLVTVYLIICKH